MHMQEQEYMSLSDAAKYLGYGSKHVVYDLIKAGMPVIKVGRRCVLARQRLMPS